MKWLLSIIFLCVAGVANSEDGGVVWPDCYCTDKAGARVELGTMICMKVGGRDFIARCEMSQNVPMWREINQGCLSSHDESIDSSDQIVDALLIDA